MADEIATKFEYNVDLEYLASLSPPINIYPISNTQDSIKTRIKDLEKYYNEFYTDDGNIPYHAKMARTLGNHDVSADMCQHEKRKNAANLSRVSRDKLRFVTARTTDDSQVLSTIFTSKLDYIIGLEKTMNDILMVSGHDPVNIIELLDAQAEDSKKANGILFDQIVLESKNAIVSDREYLIKYDEHASNISFAALSAPKQTGAISYSSKASAGSQRTTNSTTDITDICSVYSSNASNDRVGMHSASSGCNTSPSDPSKNSMLKYLRSMNVTVSQPEEYALILNICDQMVSRYMARFGNSLHHRWGG